VQTFIVQKITHSLSEQVRPASVSVGAVHYSFFTKLIVDDISVTDTKGDTLLFVNETIVSLSSFSWKQKKLTIKDIRLNHGVFNLYTYAVGVDTNSTNIKDILVNLKSEKTDTVSVSKETEKWNFKIKNVELADFRFTFRNLHKPTKNPNPAVIDFKDLDLRNIHIDLRNIRFDSDTLFFELRDVNFTEKSGYHLQKLTAKNGFVCSNQVFLNNAILTDDYSHLPMKYYKMEYDDIKDFNDYEDEVRMEADFDNAFFSFRTIKHMAKKSEIEQGFYLTGVVGGTVSNLRSDYIRIKSETQNTKLAVKFRMSGLPDIDETIMYINVLDLTTNASDLSDVIQGFANSDSLNLKSLFLPLENIKVTGNFTGLYNDFVAKANIQTNVGNVTADLSFAPDQEGLRLKGEMETEDFHIGKFVKADSLLGKMSSKLTADGIIRPASKGGISLRVSGQFAHLEFMQYDYQNITANVRMRNTNFGGRLFIDDPNLNLRFSGGIHLPTSAIDTVHILDFEANVNHADLVALGFNKNDSISTLKTVIKADYWGTKNSYDGIGNIALSEINYTKNNQVFDVGSFTFKSIREQAGYKTTIRSEFLDADYKGNKSLWDFSTYVFNRAVQQHFPILSTTTPVRDTSFNEGNFNATFKESSVVTDFIVPGLYVAPQTNITATLVSQDSLEVRVKGNRIALEDKMLQGVSLIMSNNALQNRANITVSQAELAGFTLRNISSEIVAATNKVSAQLTFDNQTTPANKGKFAAVVDFKKDHETEPMLVDLQIGKSQLTLNDSLWNIEPSNIIFNEKTHINNFRIANNNQLVELNGALSKSPTDTLTLQLNSFDIASLNAFTEGQNYKFSGILSGFARVTNIYNNPRFFANIASPNIFVNQQPLGSISIRSFWNDEDKLFRLRFHTQIDSVRSLDISGNYSPTTNNINLTGTFNRFRLIHLEPLLDGVLENIEGTISGKAQLSGNLKNLKTEGIDLQANNVAATVSYLKTRYSFDTPLFLNSTSLGFNNVDVSDQFGGKATLSFLLSHNDFRNLQYEVKAFPNNLCVMNTTERDNPSFYGIAYASGAAIIKGKPGSIDFDINLRAEKNSSIHIPASSSTNTKDAGLLTFAQPKTDTLEDNYDKEKKKINNLNVTVNISVTPETEVQIELDKKAGDIIRGFGSGEIKLEINPAIGKFNLFGDYRIERGDYLFTLQNFNFISKKFYINQGGKINFNGDIHNTHVDLTAIYKAKASLNTLLNDTSVVATTRLINCIIDMSGNMFRPTLKFSVEVEDLDAETRARVQSILSTEEKQTRQFLSLLAFGTFMPDQDAEFNSGMLYSAGTEMLSNQVNNMLNQMKVPITIGGRYIPSQQGRGDDWDLNFSTQIMDQRITINGNVGSSGQTQVLSSDFDASVQLDAKGKVHFKLFTRSVDQYSDNIDNSQRYGIGVMYQEEFNTFQELFQSLFGKKKKPIQVPEKESAIVKEPEEETSETENNTPQE